MPSSDLTPLPKIVTLLRTLSPSSVLDIGCGNGIYGLVFRQSLDMDFGRLERNGWKVRIDAVEVEDAYITPVHRYVYDNVYVADWLDMTPELTYDLIFMGDVLEHFREWQRALLKAKRYGKNVIVVAPNWSGSIAQGAWMGFESEVHQVELSPGLVGGKCVFANSKCFVSVIGGGILEHRDLLL
jgi:SAM-dependent methyltransferase